MAQLSGTRIDEALRQGSARAKAAAPAIDTSGSFLLDKGNEGLLGKPMLAQEATHRYRFEGVLSPLSLSDAGHTEPRRPPKLFVGMQMRGSALYLSVYIYICICRPPKIYV